MSHQITLASGIRKIQMLASTMTDGEAIAKLLSQMSSVEHHCVAASPNSQPIIVVTELPVSEAA